MSSIDDDWTPRWRLGDGRTDVNPARLYEVAGRWQCPAPIECRCGLELRGAPVTVAHQACLATGGHRTYYCRTCGHITYYPPETEQCVHNPFDGRP
ncbi:hypothetical protein [Nocardia vulneris]|uniref:Uncharacterized protein n=1 Tax=Nocardia vulneris TaxID=1141657 RepID=A0ABR4ZCJ0_9NOCA|nr:hypothetical protein [Nocardia vulneris]KIA62981.1 hypothetical protein FG87_21590 [Nocardia vulneris]